MELVWVSTPCNCTIYQFYACHQLLFYDLVTKKTPTWQARHCLDSPDILICQCDGHSERRFCLTIATAEGLNATHPDDDDKDLIT